MIKKEFPPMVHEERTAREGAAAGDLRSDVEALKSDVGALRRDITGLVQDLISAGKVGAGDAGQAFSSAARSRLNDFGVDFEGLSDRGLEILESAQDQIEKRPLMSMGIAFGLGMVLGSIFRRS
jgi:ElaB/YqjD/DUF883 family membrane-anchored ribosome-binding protein